MSKYLKGQVTLPTQFLNDPKEVLYGAIHEQEFMHKFSDLITRYVKNGFNDAKYKGQYEIGT